MPYCWCRSWILSITSVLLNFVFHDTFKQCRLCHFPKMFSMFVWLWFIVPLENFSLIWRRRHYRWRAANFDLCSAHMAIEQLRFLSVPNLLWHGTSIFNGHLREPGTLTPIAERLAVELSLPVLWFRSFASGIRTLNLPFAGQRSNQLRHRRGFR